MPYEDTDGDTILVVTEPSIVELRSLKRPPTLVKIDDSIRTCIINPENIREYMIDSLEDAGIGRITNWGTTWRDIELMIIHMPNPISGKYRLPNDLKNEILDLAVEARETLKMHRQDMDELEIMAAEATAAIKDINVDTKLVEWATLIIRACEMNASLIRRLQETAINTAKSGVFVPFDRYPWLKLKIRATWHRPHASSTYDSWSTMGQISIYTDDKWSKLRDWSGETSKPLNIGSHIDWTMYQEEYKHIRELKSSYGTAIHNLISNTKSNEDDQEIDNLVEDKDRMRIYRELGDYFNSILRGIAVGINSIDAVSAMVYRATNDRDKTNDEGLSFLWQCWGEEFVHTLRHLNSGSKSKRLVVVRMEKEYEEYTLPAGEYIVRDEGVRFSSHPENVVAKVRVPNGIYEIITFDEVPYLLAEIKRNTVESMAATFKDVQIRVVGIKYHTFNGEQLNRNKVKELIKASDYKLMVRIIEDTFNGKPFVGAMLYANIKNSNEPVCIGNLPKSGAKSDNSGYLTEALNEKAIRVIIPTNADKIDVNKDGSFSRLTLTIADILE